MSFHRYRRYNTIYNPSSDKNEKILFDVNDPQTMTFPKDVSTKWSKSIVAASLSTKFGVVTVYDNSFSANEVLAECKKDVRKMVPKAKGSWDIRHHCDWCGQKLDYVAVIVGIDNGTGDAYVNHIGCDCVGKIFGITWFGYRSASEVKKKLIDAAKKRRRAIEYPVKYAKELAWLDSVPEFLLIRNSFLVDMKKIMRTGERAVSKKMENYLRAIQSRQEYDPKTFASAKQSIDKTLEKLHGILHMIEEVDDEDMRMKSWSAYGFVKSITEKFVAWHSPLTQKQMDALNRVYVKYRDARLDANTKQLKGNASEIPW